MKLHKFLYLILLTLFVMKWTLYDIQKETQYCGRKEKRCDVKINNIFAMITTLFLLQEIMWITLQPTAQANGFDEVIQEANPIMYVS